MDRATWNLLVRLTASLAMGAFLLHAGQHLMHVGDITALGWGAVALILVGTVAASWAQARLNAKRAALWTTLVLMGLLPMGAFLLHRASLSEEGGYGIILLLALVFGAATTVLSGVLLARRQDS